MRLPKLKFTKKAIAIGAGVGIAFGAAGIAAAFLTASGTGAGEATLATAHTVYLSLGTTVLTLNTPAPITYYVTNPNNFEVALGTVTITHVTQVSAKTTCFKTVTPTATLLPTDVSVGTASAPVGKVGTGLTSVTGTTAATLAKMPTLDLHTTPTLTQASCTVKIQLLAHAG